MPTAEPLVRFQITGDARIVGVDNGDQFSHASFKGDRMALFSGKALVIIRAGVRPGAAILTAQAEGLEPASVRIELAPVRPRP